MNIHTEKKDWKAERKTDTSELKFMLLRTKRSQIFLPNPSLILTADSFCHISLPAAFSRHELYKAIYSSLKQTKCPKPLFAVFTAVFQVISYCIKDIAAKSDWKLVLKNTLHSKYSGNITSSRVRLKEELSHLGLLHFSKKRHYILLPGCKCIFWFGSYEALQERNNRLWNQIELKVTKILWNQLTAWTDWHSSWKPPEWLKRFWCPPVQIRPLALNFKQI